MDLFFTSTQLKTPVDGHFIKKMQNKHASFDYNILTGKVSVGFLH